MSKRVEQGQATRRQLIDIAVRLFAEQGYEATSIETVLAASGVSRGALYHHFPGKRALFEAVLEAVEADIAVRIMASARDAASPVAALRAGCMAWLRIAGDPVAQRIALIDAPAVVGWQRWREIDSRHGFGLLRQALAVVAVEGRVRPELVDVLAHMLLAALLELGLVVARSADPAQALRLGEAAVDDLLDGLLDVEPPPRIPTVARPPRASATRRVSKRTPIQPRR